MHLIIPPQQQSGYQLRAVVFTGNACGLDTQASIYSTPLFPGSLVMTSFNLMGVHSPISICGSYLAKWYYLTFYAFNGNFEKPLHPQGASADDVYKLISFLEKEALTSEPVTLESHLLEKARLAGGSIADWLQRERKLPRLGRQTYFLPLPVALVAVLP
jgi:hypothetical protein